MNKEKIAIVSDSGSDVPKRTIEKYNIQIAPLNIIYSDVEHLDGVTISNDEVYQSFEKEIPSTSLPSGENMTKIFQSLEDEGFEKVFVVAISSGLSGTANLFDIIARDFPALEISVIDTKSIGIGSGLTAQWIGERIEAGDTFKEIDTKIKEIVEASSVYFSIPTLKYLEAGGRIGHVTSFVGNLLKVNPIISCDEEGIYYMIAQARGRRKSLSKMRDIVIEEAKKFEEYNIGVAYGGQTAIEEAKQLLEELKEKLPNIKESFHGSVSPALGVHTGPGLVGVTIQPTKL